MTNAVDQLKMYVQASETTGNGKSRHCQDCRDAVAEIERLTAALKEAADWFEGEGMHRQADAILKTLSQQSTAEK